MVGDISFWITKNWLLLITTIGLITINKFHYWFNHL